MDKALREELRKATQTIRGLLEKELSEQLEGTFDILVDGTILPTPGPHLSAAQRLVREKLVAAITHKQSVDVSPQSAVEAYLREAAFTALNRFIALKMLEARGLVQQCISRGDESSGFKEFTALAPGLVQLPDKGYRLYIESLFDEIGQEVRVLFNRRDVASLLWPRRTALVALLDLINSRELIAAWGEDETIGWVYQYYNGNDVSEMRKAANGGAPRNSHELAVRNQFFTPRYVVEFLTDNTLGRIWYEMNQGQTRLKDQCRYLVRRPIEIFLAHDESAPEQVPEHLLSQEQFRQQPAYIPYRPLKDPREIRMLDPACGSMHFGLYAYDLFEVIYTEAWDIAHSGDEAWKSSTAFQSFVSFVALYDDKAAFLAEVPHLIIGHNIHGIDIDPRAAQIAGLSLWLRAQRTWQRQSLRQQDRPPIRRSNVVCAEPMPGEKAFLDEFIAEHLSATPEHRLLGQLVRRVFAAMKLAGEAGSLLKIEEEIASAVAEAKEKWLAPRTVEQLSLLVDDAVQPSQQELDLNVAGITDEGFWEQAEERIYTALQTYAEQAEQSGGYQRRLFADDAARGFAFIDICRQRYDVLLMNPPFGDASNSAIAYLERTYTNWNANLLCALIQRSWEWTKDSGCLGAIFDRTAIVKSTYADFRRHLLVEDDRIFALADLGWEVLDANVEVTTSVLHHSPNKIAGAFTDLRTVPSDKKGNVLLSRLQSLRSGETNDGITIAMGSEFSQLPNAVVGYDFPAFLGAAFKNIESIQDMGFKAYQGHALKSEKHFRVWWELPGIIGEYFVRRLFNGAGFSPYHTAYLDCVIAPCPLEELSKDSATVLRNTEHQGKAGVCFGKRGEFYCAHILPVDFIFTVEGQAIPVKLIDEALVLLGFLNTPLIRDALNKYCGQHKYSGYVNLLPFARFGNPERVASYVREALIIGTKARRLDEVQPFFFPPLHAKSLSESAEIIAEVIQASREAARLAESYCQEQLLVAFQVMPHEAKDIAIFQSRQPVNESPIEDCSDENSYEWFVAHSAISCAIGCVFGRWNIYFATGEKAEPELPEPFASLSVCPPGQLQNEQGLPITQEDVARLKEEGRWEYPVDILWDGILVDDLGHPLDIEAHVHSILRRIWEDRCEAIEHEACDILGVSTLRDYFRKPAGFFADHLRRYSKNRRKAPIYWPLSTKSASYTVWIYYHRFDRDTFFQVLGLVKNKLEHESSKLRDLQQVAGSNPGSNQRTAIEEQDQFVEELSGLRDEVARIAPLWNPNLNDGVIINFAPLWRLVPQNANWQKECKAVWDKLIVGEYDWSHLAMHLWPDRVVPKCLKDRSLAIAHGLDDVFWQVGEKGKWQPVSIDSEHLRILVAERTSPAVKSALQSLLDAPAPRGANRSRGAVTRRTVVPRPPAATSSISSTNTTAFEVDDVTLKAVRQAIASVVGGAAKADVLSSTGLSDSDWNKAINVLLSNGEVTRSGEKRGTRYHASTREETENE